MRTIYDDYLSMPRFYLPEDQDMLRAYWMNPAQAMKKWGVSKSTVYRYMQLYPDQIGLSHISIYPAYGDPYITIAIRADAKKPELKRGNPNLKDSQYQSRIAKDRENRRRKSHPVA